VRHHFTPQQIPPFIFFIMPDVIFNFGGTSKEVNLKDINSVDDIASNMKEVIKKEKESKGNSNA